MPDEKPVADATEASDRAYRAELEERVKKSAEDMGISTEEKPEEPAKDDPEAPAEETEEVEGEGEGEDEKKPADEKYSKALRKIQKQEAELQQFKSQVIAQERDVKQREQKVQQNEQELGQFIRQLQLDPFITLMKAGLMSEDDAEYASKQLYFQSKAAASDPKNKQEAERLRRERQLALESQQTRQEIDKLKREREQERQEAQQRQNTDAYVARIDATIEAQKVKAPLLAKALEKHPAETRQELLRIANDLSYAKQAYADPQLVILAWVKERKRILASMGINEPAAKSTSEQAKSKPAAEKKGTPNGANGSSQAQADLDADKAFKAELKARLDGTYVEP